jgi:hypothetical protein
MEFTVLKEVLCCVRLVCVFQILMNDFNARKRPETVTAVKKINIIDT